jgi:acyl-CoA synthetase (AMP-forming)/AMP-acid ligase II
MPLPNSPTLWQRARAAGGAAKLRLYGSTETVELGSLTSHSALSTDPDKLRGKAVLLATADQLSAALALLELDGVARRLVLCPPDLAAGYVPTIIAAAGIDVVVGDSDELRPGGAGIEHVVSSRPCRPRSAAARGASERTEWVLMTSGTTAAPKLVVHTLNTLTGGIGSVVRTPDAVWSTFYDIRRYGGLQIFLRAIQGGASMVLSSAGEAVADFLSRAGECAVTHMSGTPSHWRRAAMSAAAGKISPRYIRLSGEISDQTILDHLQRVYPNAQVAHAFASTEGGVAFDVRDGLAGFPSSLVESSSGDLAAPAVQVELRIKDGSLQIRSNRTALGYLRGGIVPLTDLEGFVDTGDIVERHGGRYHFAGRRDGVINVGGQKVHPEEVEAVINSHPSVRMSLVRARSNPITGGIVVAEIMAQADAPDREAIKREILDECRQVLASYKVPAVIRFVSSLEVAASGKLMRAHA